MVELQTGDVQYASGDVRLRGYVARPKTTATYPGVVLIQEWWGLNDHIKSVGDRLAMEGFAVLVPDLYSRFGSPVAKDAKEAGRLMDRLRPEDGVADLLASIAWLKGQPGVHGHRLGTLGFCMGGSFALRLACHSNDLKASVAFYGQVPSFDDLRELRCPVLYLYGDQDGWITTEEVSRLQHALQRYSKSGEVKIFPGAPHAFFNDTRPDVYRAAEAQAAWHRLLAFFRQHLV